MFIKISNKTFYDRHINEVQKFLINKKALHIINRKSKGKIYDDTSERLYLNITDKDLIQKDKKYDVVILTDIIETHPNVFDLFSQISDILNDDGKFIISTFNTKYKFVIRAL